MCCNPKCCSTSTVGNGGFRSYLIGKRLNRRIDTQSPPRPVILENTEAFFGIMLSWLVVILTILKNISQWEGLSHIYYGK